jgi:predicted nuclease of predicted toxin-antitoxin system
MNWRNNFRSSVEKIQNSGFLLSDTAFEISPLLSQIGDRDVVVDACLPPQLANDLRSNNVNAIWVPAILGDGASDGEIERQLLAGRWNQKWGSADREKVLLTRDVEFYKRIRGRAILVSYRLSNPSARKMSSNATIRKEVKRIIRERNSTMNA